MRQKNQLQSGLSSSPDGRAILLSSISKLGDNFLDGLSEDKLKISKRYMGMVYMKQLVAKTLNHYTAFTKTMFMITGCFIKH